MTLWTAERAASPGPRAEGRSRRSPGGACLRPRGDRNDRRGQSALTRDPSACGHGRAHARSLLVPAAERGHRAARPGRPSEGRGRGRPTRERGNVRHARPHGGGADGARALTQARRRGHRWGRAVARPRPPATGTRRPSRARSLPPARGETGRHDAAPASTPAPRRVARPLATRRTLARRPETLPPHGLDLAAQPWLAGRGDHPAIPPSTRTCDRLFSGAIPGRRHGRTSSRGGRSPVRTKGRSPPTFPLPPSCESMG